MGTGTAIVAIPAEDDYVWKISTEKVPHLTLLFLGDQSQNPNLGLISEFLQHVVEDSMHRFGMSVDRRGPLGPDDADVVFFEPRKMISEARGYLLANDTISAAYNSVVQFPEWQPHLTLGYPADPAKEDPREYPGINWVNFDRIALWVGDFTGPEYRLKDNMMSEVYMSELEEQGTSTVAKILGHSGVKGMKWGVRKGDSAGGYGMTKNGRKKLPTSVEVTQPKAGKKLKTSGGKNQPASEDARKAAATRQKAKSSTTDALSNVELKQLVERMNLEANYTRLSATQKSAGRKFAEKFFTNEQHRKQTLDNLENLNTGIGKSLDKVLPGGSIKRTDLSNIGK